MLVVQTQHSAKAPKNVVLGLRTLILSMLLESRCAHTTAWPRSQETGETPWMGGGLSKDEVLGRARCTWPANSGSSLMRRKPGLCRKPGLYVADSGPWCAVEDAG